MFISFPWSNLPNLFTWSTKSELKEAITKAFSQAQRMISSTNFPSRNYSVYGNNSTIEQLVSCYHFDCNLNPYNLYTFYLKNIFEQYGFISSNEFDNSDSEAAHRLERAVIHLFNDPNVQTLRQVCSDLSSKILTSNFIDLD